MATREARLPCSSSTSQMRCATSRLLTLRCEAKRSSWLPMLGLMKRFWLPGKCAF